MYFFFLNKAFIQLDGFFTFYQALIFLFKILHLSACPLPGRNLDSLGFGFIVYKMLLLFFQSSDEHYPISLFCVMSRIKHLSYSVKLLFVDRWLIFFFSIRALNKYGQFLKEFSRISLTTNFFDLN